VRQAGGEAEQPSHEVRGTGAHVYPGNCDGTPIGHGPRLAVIIVEGARGADVGTPAAMKEVTLRYAGTDLSSRCASYTE